jgi:hypothetical protein
MAIFGTAITPPAWTAFSTLASRLSTSTMQANVLTCAPSSGPPGNGRGISPPSIPGTDLSPVEISQYGWSPHWVNFQPTAPRKLIAVPDFPLDL